MTKREAALEKALTFKGTTEIGGNNRGPLVEVFLKSTGLGPGYPWCMAFAHYVAGLVGLTLGGGAGVGAFLSWARKLGYEVTRPQRADYVCFAFSSSWPTDHVGQIVRVLKRGPLVALRTIEGNTSSGVAGSQDDGGGVYVRTRIVRSSRVAFVRVPGEMPIETFDALGPRGAVRLKGATSSALAGKLAELVQRYGSVTIRRSK